MNLYGIAKRRVDSAGQNCNFDIWVIEGTGSYGAPPYPPVFASKDAAEAYLDTINKHGQFKVIELHMEP